MSKQTEALKLALECIERGGGIREGNTVYLHDHDLMRIARDALREALAEQTAQQQEPVAWDNCRSEKQCRSWCGNSACGSHWNDTSPPASKPWVGLSTIELDEIDAPIRERGHATIAEIYQAIEAKLREKNHG